MRLCASRANEFIADLPRKGQVSKGPVQVSELAPAQAKFNAAEAMVVRGDAFPSLNGLTDYLQGCLLGHVTPHPTVSLDDAFDLSGFLGIFWPPFRRRFLLLRRGFVLRADARRGTQSVILRRAGAGASDCDQ